MNGGVPRRAAIEIFGWSGSGKTSLGIKLSAKAEGHVAVAETENRFNLDYLKTNLAAADFKHDVYMLPIRKLKKNEILLHEDLIKEFLDTMALPEFGAGIWDSIGAIVAEADLEGRPGSGYGTERAKLVWHIYRHAAYVLLRRRPRTAPPANIYLLNHQMEALGRGTKTAGGRGPEYLSTARIKMWAKKKRDDGCLEIEGKILKTASGPIGGSFKLFLIPDYGLHEGMSAMLDCHELKIIKRESHGIYMKGVNLGRIGTLIDAAKKNSGKPFNPFYRALSEFDKTGDTQKAAAAGAAVVAAKAKRKATRKKRTRKAVKRAKKTS